MIKHLGIAVALVLSICSSVLAQKPKPVVPAPKPAPKEVSDPKAKAVLDKILKQYNGYKSMETTFTLTIQVSGAKVDVQKGKLIQQGAQYAMTMDKQAVFCDAKTVWFYQKKINEVQVSSVSIGDDSPVLGPKQLLKIYQSGQYIYAITGEGVDAGKNVQYIEFKPVNRNGEYTKIRLAIEKGTSQIVYFKAFTRDATQYTMTLGPITANKTYSSATFVFDKMKYPGVRVEDLRID